MALYLLTEHIALQCACDSDFDDLAAVRIRFYMRHGFRVVREETWDIYYLRDPVALAPTVTSGAAG